MDRFDILQKASDMNLEYGDEVVIDGFIVKYSNDIEVAVGFFVEGMIDVKGLKGWEIPSKELINNYVDLYNSGSRVIPSIHVDCASGDILDGNHRVGAAKKLKIKQLKAWLYIGDEI